MSEPSRCTFWSSPTVVRFMNESPDHNRPKGRLLAIEIVRKLAVLGFTISILLWVAGEYTIGNSVTPGFCLALFNSKFGAERGQLFWVHSGSSYRGWEPPAGLHSSGQVLCEAERSYSRLPWFRVTQDGEIRIWIPILYPALFFLALRIICWWSGRRGRGASAVAAFPIGQTNGPTTRR